MVTDVAAQLVAESPSSLAYIRANAHKKSGCLNGRLDWLHLPTGDRFPESCRRLGCDFCGPIQAQARAQLAAAANPERLVTLTKVPSDWQERREFLMHVRYRIRREGYAWQDFHATEPNPKGTGYHVHMLQHGDYIPQKRLARIVGTVVDIRAIHREIETSGRVARYVLKGAGGGAAPYVVKGSAASLGAHLEINGGRPAHWTRGYMRSEDGDPITARALRALVQKSRGNQDEYAHVARTATDEECRNHMRRYQESVATRSQEKP